MFYIIGGQLSLYHRIPERMKNLRSISLTVILRQGNNTFFSSLSVSRVCACSLYDDDDSLAFLKIVYVIVYDDCLRFLYQRFFFVIINRLAAVVVYVVVILSWFPSDLISFSSTHSILFAVFTMHAVSFIFHSVSSFHSAAHARIRQRSSEG